MSSKGNNIYTLKRMIPPGVVEYCFQFFRGSEFVKEHAVDQPTLNKLKKVVNRQKNPFTAMALNAKRGSGKPFTRSVLLGEISGGGGEGGRNAANFFGGGGGGKKKNLLLTKLESVKKKLNERERAYMQGIAEASLYGTGNQNELHGPVNDDLDVLRSNKKLLQQVNAGLQMAHDQLIPKEVVDLIEKSKLPRDGAEAKLEEHDPPKSPKVGGKKTKSKSKGKGKGKEKEKEKQLQLQKKEISSKKDLTTKTTTPAEQRLPQKKLKQGWVLPEVALPEEKNSSLINAGEVPFRCVKAFPRKTKYGDDEDEDDDLAKRHGKNKEWDISKSSWGGRGRQNESKDYYDVVNGNPRIHNRACAADFTAGKVIVRNERALMKTKYDTLLN